jgi:myo-inositol 2-dehydrogenase / D-chiro-inositol 1-dehydrogenase
VVKRIAIVGAGAWASAMHFPACRRLREQGLAEYCGVCDCDQSKAQRAADLLDGKPYTELAQMLASERPDGLIILVKPDATPHLIQTAIDRRLPFLTEKPPATSVSVHQRLMEAAGDLPHVIAYNRRFTPYVAKAREWIDQRSLQSVEASLCRFRRLDADFTSTAVHAIDAALFLAGSRVAEARIEAVRRDSVTNLFLSAWTVDNCHISLVVTPNSGFNDEEYTLRTTSRNARVVHPQDDKHTGRVCLFEDGQLREDLSARDIGMEDLPSVSGIVGEQRHFIGLLEGRCASMATLRDTLNTQIIREACAGLRDGKPRELKEIAF